MNVEGSFWQLLASKCVECGIEPEAFLREKLLELEERKGIILTPTRSWFNANRMRYNEFASRMLRRELTASERHDKEAGLTFWVVRRLKSKAKAEVVDLSVRRLLLEESKGRCTVCGQPLTTNTMQVDHRIPLAAGGSNHTLNLQALCGMCNQGKGDYFEETAQVRACPWDESRQRLINGEVRLSATKTFCVLTRDGSTCRKCGIKASEAILQVVHRVPQEEGGQLVYDNLLTLCTACCPG